MKFISILVAAVLASVALAAAMTATATALPTTPLLALPSASGMLAISAASLLTTVMTTTPATDLKPPTAPSTTVQPLDIPGYSRILGPGRPKSCTACTGEAESPSQWFYVALPTGPTSCTTCTHGKIAAAAATGTPSIFATVVVVVPTAPAASSHHRMAVPAVAAAVLDQRSAAPLSHHPSKNGKIGRIAWLGKCIGHGECSTDDLEIPTWDGKRSAEALNGEPESLQEWSVRLLGDCFGNGNCDMTPRESVWRV